MFNVNTKRTLFLDILPQFYHFTCLRISTEHANQSLKMRYIKLTCRSVKRTASIVKCVLKLHEIPCTLLWNLHSYVLCFDMSIPIYVYFLWYLHYAPLGSCSSPVPTSFPFGRTPAKGPVPDLIKSATKSEVRTKKI